MGQVGSELVVLEDQAPDSEALLEQTPVQFPEVMAGLATGLATTGCWGSARP